MKTKKENLEARLAKAKENVNKSKEKIKELKKKLKNIKSMDGFTPRQDKTRKLWYGRACLALMETDSELASCVHDYLDKKVKSSAQRKILGLDNRSKNIAQQGNTNES